MSDKVRDIIVAPDPRLRRIAKVVDTITADDLSLIDEMFKVMVTSNGIGLAANQVGADRRIIVMDVDRLEAYDDGDSSTLKHGKFVMINPAISSRQGSAQWNEGCLSVPGFREPVERSANIRVTFLDVNGQKQEMSAAGLLAACVQHEIDHLDGKLFIDKLSKLKRDIINKKLSKAKDIDQLDLRA